jgi:hypothetical protein
MDSRGIAEAVQAISNDIMEIIQIVFDSEIGINNKVGKNTLDDSNLRKQIEKKITSNDNIIMSYYFNDYIVYIESGRRKGAKMIPISALKSWADRKGIPSDNNTLYAISKAIVRDGIAPRPLMSMIMENVTAYIADNDFKDLFDSIVIDVSKFFNKK